MLQLDAIGLAHLCRRIEQLKSYRGTPDEMFGDDSRLALARHRANALILRIIFDR